MTLRLCVLLYWFLYFGVSCLKLKKLDVPEYMLSGDKGSLTCDYDLEGDVLYAVKWYKGEHEFFRYLPGLEQPRQIFEVRGIRVSVNESTATSVTLESVNLDTEGLYRCEVSSEAPNFHTIVHGAKMDIYVLPGDPPVISGAARKYQVGEPLFLNCTSGWAKPRAELHWYLNDGTAPYEYVTSYPPRRRDKDLYLTTQSLHFSLQQRHFKNNHKLHLKCVSSVAGLYWQSSEMTIKGPNVPTVTVMGSQEKVYSRACMPCSNALSLVLFCLLLFHLPLT